METEAFSVKSFCDTHNISRTLFYRLIERGDGPTTFKVGDRTLISREAAAEWRARLEKRSNPD